MNVRQGQKIQKLPLIAASVVKYENYNKRENYTSTDVIYCIDGKYDYGYENVVTHVENMTPEQLKKWNKLKKEVPNTSILRKLKEDDYPYFWDKSKKKTSVTQIGWF